MLQKEATSSAQQALIDRLVVGSTLLKVSNSGKLSRVSARTCIGSDLEECSLRTNFVVPTGRCAHALYGDEGHVLTPPVHVQRHVSLSADQLFVKWQPSAKKVDSQFGTSAAPHSFDAEHN
jgi:hypothetical protein